MRNALYRFSLFALLALLAFSAHGQTQPASKTPGTVYIYRYRLTVGTSVHPTVSCDTFEAAKIQNGRYYAMKTAPGRHNITMSGSPGITLDVESGKDYFVRIDYGPNASFGVGGTLILVPPDQGRADMLRLKALDAWFVQGGGCGI